MHVNCIQQCLRGLSVFFVLSIMISTMVVLTGCDLGRNHLKIDRSTNLEFQAFRDALAPRIIEEDVFDDDIPDFQSYVAPPSDDLKAMPLISISINQTVPLRDILFELAEQADYDIQLDPSINGAIIFTARDRPFDVIIDQISDIAGLRYRFKDGFLRIELDRPYSKTYKINYLNYTRNNSSSIRNDVSVVSGDGADTGSSFEASGESSSDFWGELEVNLTHLLNDAANYTLRTRNNPSLSVVAQAPAPVTTVLARDEEGNISVTVQAPKAVLQVQSLPVGSDGGEEGEVVSASFSMNKQSGILLVLATEKQHKQVGAYLEELRRSVMTQVLIEAKIFEVTLSDEFSTGIDWELLRTATSKLTTELVLPSTSILFNDTSAANIFRLSYQGSNVDALVETISRFGTVHALANPRMTVLNNQSAVLNVATNVVYFEIDIETTTEDGVTDTTISSEIRNVPEGVLINVQPSVDLDRQIISMALRPTITRISNRVEDPAVAFVAELVGSPISSFIPEVNVQEIDSIIKVRSGETIVMGGLMQDRNESVQTGVPMLSEIPLFGALFRKQRDKVTKTELVIFLKATILDGSNVDEIDRYLYKKFSGDRHPFKL